ncbi:MAG: adenylate/guanylate cyclase domain-containing protein [Candidatus Marinimicrobia bacterium]|nr:adenylate/guanylate cyclase domain-containing protein [Candidatus Neomarinimicrobiota bacterium]
MSSTLKRIFTGTIIGLVIGILVGLSTNKSGFFLTELLNKYELNSFDARIRARVSDVPEMSIEDIVIVDIDQNSVMELGNYKDWPQAYHGQLIDVISSGNPKAILFDIIFDPEYNMSYDVLTSLDIDSSHSQAQALNDFVDLYDPMQFVQATYESQKVYHALVFETTDSTNFLYAMDDEIEGYFPENHTISLPEEQAQHLPRAPRMGNTYADLLTYAKGTGSANFPQDADGIIRRAPTALYFDGPGDVYPSLSMAAAMDILGVPKDGLSYDFESLILTMTDTTGTVVRELPIDEEGRIWVNFSGPFKTFYYIPYMYCFDAELLDPSYWEGKIAIVGSSLPGLMDLRNTSVQKTFAGVEIHANTLYNIINDDFIRPVKKSTQLLTLIALSLCVGLLISLPPKPLYSLPIPLAAVFVWIVFAYNQFLNQLIIWDIVRPILSIGAVYLTVFLYNFLVVDKDKRFLKQTFSTYISPELIDRMFKDHTEPQLGGEEGYHTAYFTDIQSFSGFSEKLTPHELVELLNEYLTEMTDILLENKGTLDKYIGDAIVAFYGAPVPVEQHEYRACLTALIMQDRLVELREKWRSEGDRWPEIVHNMQNRIGINSGQMVTGNMGSGMRMNYTMMGDTVNLAARLEASAKQYGIYIQVAETTYQKVKDLFEWRDLDYVRVMGKTEPVHVYELISEKGKLTGNYVQLLEVYNEALACYIAQKWDEGLALFKKADALEDMFPGRKTNPSLVYIDRCNHFKENPPGDDWNGVWTLTSK